MPWKETCPMDLRESLVLSVLAKEASVLELCRRASIAPKTAYKWLARFREGGRDGLADRSRARLTQEHAVSGEVADLIVATRKAHPTWGPKKLHRYLDDRHVGIKLPSLSTMGEILKRANLVQTPSRVPRHHGRVTGLCTPTAPNQVWTIDFKGHFRLGSGEYCYPLTVVDRFSRFVLRIDAKPSTQLDGALATFRALFREHGLPERIRSDNGTPFAGPGLARLSRLNVWFMRLGVVVERINPGRPGENGSHERMHRTLKAETARPPKNTMRSQQRRFDAFRQEYNQERPHEGIDQQTPGSLYESSSRPYRSTLPEDVYPGHWERRRVRTDGGIWWRGANVFVTEALIGRHVGLIEIDDGLWQLHYRQLLLGLLDCRGPKARVRDVIPSGVQLEKAS